MRLGPIDFAPHVRLLGCIRHHQTILQQPCRVYDTLACSDLALGHSQSCGDSDISDHDTELCDLLRQRQACLLDVLDCRWSCAANLRLELANELCDFIFPVSNLLLVRNCNISTCLALRIGTSRNNFLLNL